MHLALQRFFHIVSVTFADFPMPNNIRTKLDSCNQYESCNDEFILFQVNSATYLVVCYVTDTSSS